MYRKILFLCTIFFVIISIGLVFAQETGEGGAPAPVPSNATGEGGGAIGTNTSIKLYPSYSEITGAFNNQTWLPVIVRLKDNSDIDNLLSSLSENDFDGEGTSIGFVGFITKNGFETLLNDSRVKAISWTKYGAQASLENKSKPQNISEIEKEPESEIITDVSKSEEINELEEKNLIWPWMMIIAIIVLSVIFYLIIKFRKK